MKNNKIGLDDLTPFCRLGVILGFIVGVLWIGTLLLGMLLGIAASV